MVGGYQDWVKDNEIDRGRLEQCGNNDVIITIFFEYLEKKGNNLDSRANIDHDSIRRSVACFPSMCMINNLNRMTFPKFDFIMAN